MNILSLEGIVKGFGSGNVLDGVSFGLEGDERMGIIGRNGSGKTTLLRIIAGLESVDRGKVVFKSQCQIGYVSQIPVFKDDQIVLDAVFDQDNPVIQCIREYEAACREPAGNADAELSERLSVLTQMLDVSGGWAIEAAAKAVLGKLGIFDTAVPIGSLSGGQRKRVALARGLISRPDLLILDEPTNHLDADTVVWLEEYLEKYSGALLLVTHDRYFLDRVTNRILEIDKGKTQRFEGNYSYFLEKKEEREIRLEGEARKRENLVRRELAWLRRGARARATKQKAHVQRAQALLASSGNQIERSIEMSAPISRLGNKILELDRICKSFGSRSLIESFSHKLVGGDRIGIIGPNGSGKTTLLNIIAQKVPYDSGRVEFGETAVVGYFEQEPELNLQKGKLNDDLRVIEFVKEIAENLPAEKGAVISAGQMLERFLFPPDVHYSPVNRLSGGEQRRLALLKVLMGAPNILLLDEPTNDFDIATLVALESYLDNYEGCLIVASHDRAFLDRVVDQVFKIEPDGKVRGYPGNFSTYLEIFSAETAEAQENSSGAKDRPGKATTFEKSNDKSKLSFKEKREFEEIQSQISTMEARKAEIEGILENPQGDFESITSLTTELIALTEDLENKIDRWAELADRE